MCNLQEVNAQAKSLSIASGLAMALKMDRASNKVFTVIDVSDLQNGQVLEAATSAAHYNLDNLILFIDDAEFQADGTVRAVMDTGFVQAKLDSFGWRVIRVPDGIQSLSGVTAAPSAK